MGKMTGQSVPEVCPPHNMTTQPLGWDPGPERQESRETTDFHSV